MDEYLIDNYVNDTTMLIWSEKFNLSIADFSEGESISINVDNFSIWLQKVNVFIGDGAPITAIDTFETWRTKYNTAVGLKAITADSDTITADSDTVDASGGTI